MNSSDPRETFLLDAWFADVCRRALKVCRRVLLLLDTMVAVGNELDHQVLLLDPLVTMTIA